MLEDLETYKASLEVHAEKSAWFDDLCDCFEDLTLEQRMSFVAAASICLDKYGEVADKNQRAKLLAPQFQEEIRFLEDLKQGVDQQTKGFNESLERYRLAQRKAVLGVSAILGAIAAGMILIVTGMG